MLPHGTGCCAALIAGTAPEKMMAAASTNRSITQCHDSECFWIQPFGDIHAE